MIVGTPNIRRFYMGQPTTGVTTPTSTPAASAGSTGYSLPAGTYYVAYTWLISTNASGHTETDLSPIVTVTTSTAGTSLTINIPSFPPGVTGANIYIGTASGQANMHLQTTLSTTTSYSQQAALNTTSALAPASNTTATPTTLYTAPANTSLQASPYATAVIKEIIVSNNSATSAATIVLGINGVAASNLILPSKTVNANDSIILTQLNTPLNAADTLQAMQGGNSNLTVIVSGIEVQ